MSYEYLFIMVRPTSCRRICFEPNVVYFKPAGVPMYELEEIIMPLDEIEAVRLKDLESLEQEDCNLWNVGCEIFIFLAQSSCFRLGKS
jgi:predicted DNA-binding protein (UPF0251 family)